MELIVPCVIACVLLTASFLLLSLELDRAFAQGFKAHQSLDLGKWKIKE